MASLSKSIPRTRQNSTSRNTLVSDSLIRSLMITYDAQYNKYPTTLVLLIVTRCQCARYDH